MAKPKYKKGEKVEAKIGLGWMPGTVESVDTPESGDPIYTINTVNGKTKRWSEGKLRKPQK